MGGYSSPLRRVTLLIDLVKHVSQQPFVGLLVHAVVVSRAFRLQAFQTEFPLHSGFRRRPTPCVEHLAVGTEHETHRDCDV